MTSQIATRNLMIAICIFSAMAAVGKFHCYFPSFLPKQDFKKMLLNLSGLVIGLIISSVGTEGSMDTPIIILEALATGTFIYVTFLELVPHEFMGDVKNGPVKVFVMALGFATMAAFQLLDYDVVFAKPLALNETMATTIAPTVTGAA